MSTDENTLALFQSSGTVDVTVPAPGAMFRNVIISPRNLALAAQNETGRLLTRRELNVYRKQHKYLGRQLEQLGYLTILQHRDGLRAGLIEMQRRKVAGENTDSTIRLLLLSLRAINRQIRRLGPTIQDYQQAVDMLTEHEAAKRREKAHEIARRQLRDETANFVDIIRATWSRLGMHNRYMVNNKTVTEVPNFSNHQVTPDAIWLKIHTTRKALFGYDSALPEHVRAYDLICDDTCRELTIACQRQVEGVYNNRSGAWIKLNRLGTTDGLLELVTYTQVISRYDHRNHDSVPLPIGVQSGRVICWIPLSHYPHYLIAGTTGSGKSNITRVIISTIITKHSPANVRLILVDMKEGSEFAIYEDRGVPHLGLPIVRSPADLVEVLARLENMRIDRQNKFKQYYALNIEDYNAAVPPAERLARVVVIIDEFSKIKLNDAYASDSENRAIEQRCMRLIRQLLAMSRSAGIHLILSTQAPYAEILPGPDKANIAVRLSGPLTKTASMTVFGTGEAGDIPNIPGRMVVQIGNQTWPIQSPYINPADVETAIELSQAWGDVSPFDMPEAQANRYKFDRETVLDISLREYGGRLSARAMWDGTIRHMDGPTFPQLVEIVNRIVDSSEPIVYEGISYKTARTRGGGSRLIIDEDKTDSTILQTHTGPV